MKKNRAHLVIALNLDSMRAMGRGEKTSDIWDMIKDLPGIELISGSTAISIHVAVRRSMIGRLRRRVEKTCSVGPYREFRVNI